MDAAQTTNGGLEHKRKKVKTDWICVNSKCVKSKAENVITAKPFVIAYFGGKVDEKRKRKVCQDCFVEAKVSLNRITQKIQDEQPFIGNSVYVLTMKYPLRGYILGVLAHTTAWDRLWGGDVF